MKYIILDHHGNEYAVLFDEVLTHSQVAHGRYVKAAGFCRLRSAEEEDERQYDGNGLLVEVLPVVWGESVSLGVKSRSEDAAVITRSLTRRI